MNQHMLHLIQKTKTPKPLQRNDSGVHRLPVRILPRRKVVTNRELIAAEQVQAL